MLIELADLLTADEVCEARKQLASAPWTDGRQGTGEQAVQAKNNEQLPMACVTARALGAIVVRALDRHPDFLAAAFPKKVFPPRFNRYSGSTNFYGDHVDGSIRFTEQGQRVRTDVSCTVFLSDPDSYDGGELEVRDTYGSQRVKLPAGHAVLYPGTSVHQVRPVTRGERLASFFWIESMVRSAEQRRLLFEMDMALTRLRRAHGDSADTVALAGAYHNLLRQWADT